MARERRNTTKIRVFPRYFPFEKRTRAYIIIMYTARVCERQGSVKNCCPKISSLQHCPVSVCICYYVYTVLLLRVVTGERTRCVSEKYEVIQMTNG